MSDQGHNYRSIETSSGNTFVGPNLLQDYQDKVCFSTFAYKLGFVEGDFVLKFKYIVEVYKDSLEHLARKVTILGISGRATFLWYFIDSSSG